MTALGPIDPASLGITLAHEHLLVDTTTYWNPAGWTEAADPDHPIELSLLGRIRRDPVGVTRDNLRIDDPALVAREVREYLAAGGRSVVDLTPRGAGFDPARVAALVRSTGLQVVLGTAFYLERTHPPELASWPIEQIVSLFMHDLSEGFAEAPGVWAGVIGEIGTSDPIKSGEARVLRAAARAQALTGAPLVVHLQEWGANGGAILDIVASEGANLARVALAHLDSRLDLTYHRALADRGAILSYDLFGTEEYRIREGRGNPCDAERVGAVAELVRRGYGDRLLISTDICTKIQLTAYGGNGYGHILVNVVPMLRDAGVSEGAIKKVLVDNPRRFLTIP